MSLGRRPVVLHEDFLCIIILMGMFQEGALGRAKHCIVNALDPNRAMSATEVTQHCFRQPDHLVNPSAAAPTLPYVIVFLASNMPPRRRPRSVVGRAALPSHPFKQFGEKCIC
jgi:hypothetical protein